MSARPIRVHLRPNLSFHDSVVRIQALWDLTKKGVPFDETEARLQGILTRVTDGTATAEEQAEWNDREGHTRKVLVSAMPLAHYVTFTLVVENHSRAFLDQFVRELVTGIDVWTGSSRINDAMEFHEQGHYQNGTSVEVDPELLAVREQSLAEIQAIYRREVEAGATTEQAREILPLVISLPVTCTASIRRLAWIVSKRTSFILQKSLWGPVIEQILDQLTQWDAGIGANFRVPPCVLRNQCPYAIDLKGRWTPKVLDPGTSPEQWVQQVDSATVESMDTRRDYHDPNAVCPVYVDRWAGPDRDALLAFARAKHPEWDQIAADYFAYSGLQPQWLTDLPEPTGKSAH